MKKAIRRIVCILLTAALISGLVLPAAALAASAETDGVVSMGNSYITVDVSEKNGGFSVNTDTGDKLNKSDDNKALLYHDGEYDTSFTSFEVTYADGSAKDYLFGGSYGFLGMSSSDVTVSKVSDSEIDATWSLDKLTFTQKLTLVNSGADEHGMVSIGYDMENSGGSVVSVKARVLLDTALGDQDYGYFEVVDANGAYRSIKAETVLTASNFIPQNFYAYDDPYNPTITAYTVSKRGEMPYQAAFGHWNDLASTLFDFAPDNTLDFTDPYNKYLTADSAYALYYDLGSVSPSGGSGSFLTYYGVYSHKDVPAGNAVTIDVTASTALSLNDAKTAYVPQLSIGSADFDVQAEIKNLTGDTAKDYSSLTLAIYTSSGLMPLDANGDAVPGLTYDDTVPYTLSYADVKSGATVTDTLYFSAKPSADTEYRKVKFRVYDTSSTAALTTDSLLGEKVFYILCPGTDGNLPAFTFTSLTPDIIYCSGTRHLFLTGTNINILYDSIQNGNCALKAYSKDASGQIITILKENVFQPDTNKLDIVLSDDMANGDWYLKLEWADSVVGADVGDGCIVTKAQQYQTAPALSFTVTDDKSYKNDTYGVVAVVELAKPAISADAAYRILSFSGESTFDAYKKAGNYDKILLVFRGEFDVKSTTYDSATGANVPTEVTATSTKTSVDAKAANVISINNCIDFEDGVLTIKYDSVAGGFGGIQVSFDGHLYTSGARTSIWKGEAAFTKIDQGTEFGLIPYTEDGERAKNFTAKPISLVWPSTLGAAQTVAGMVFNFAYGQLGVMEDNNCKEIGRLVSFSAKLDLGFLIPSGKSKTEENTYWTRLKNYWKFYKEGQGGMYSYWATQNVDNILDFSNEKKNENTGAASVMVQDILYGCGKGFVGVHFSANVAIPSYVENMPQVEGTLEVNTVGDWSFGVEGKMKMETFTLEAALTLKSYNNIPVPDKIYFFVNGFEPGINVDGCGVVWITGGGGGIDDLYDTVFLQSGVPPLKILLSVSFDLLKVLSARADLSLGLTGFSISSSDMTLKDTDIVVLNKMAAELDWYPDLYLMGSLGMAFYGGLIKGSGYIVLESENYSEWFFEAFVRAEICIPASIPLVGGMTVAGVDLGVNSQKIWGALKVLCVSLGITYYWGGSVKFGSGDSVTKPTYPSLLGCEDTPVYYDKDNDRTLYMHVGTNLSIAAQDEITDDSADMARLMDSTSPYLGSSGDKLSHKFNLGTRSGSNDAMVTIQYAASGLDDAQKLAGKIKISDKEDGTGSSYDLTFYKGGNAATANANVTYDDSVKDKDGKGKGSLSFTMTDVGCYGKYWYFTTPVVSDVILYNVASMPEITSVSAGAETVASGSGLTVSWSGSQLDKLDSVKFYLVSDTDNTDGGYPLGELTESAAISGGSTSFTVPSNIPSGDYYIRAVYAEDDTVNNVANSSGMVDVTNVSTPAAVSISSVSSAGDLKFKVGLDNPAADAYIVTVYKQDADSGEWVSSDVNGMVIDKSDLVNNTLTVGGSYTFADASGNTKTSGLAPGVGYRIGVTSCNYVDSDGDGMDDTGVCSAERFYSSSGSVTDIGGAATVTLPEPAPPTVTITADRTPAAVPRTVGNKIESFDTYSSSDLTFTVSADKAMTNTTWTLDGDGGTSGTISGTTASIPLTGLPDGDHTLAVKGTGPKGDGFRNTYSFTVDTLAPLLLLSSPTNGSFFNEDGTLTVTGTTDADALFSVSCDGVTACVNRSISELGGTIDSSGMFSFTIALPNAESASSREVTITASDAVGNSTSEEATVVNGGLSDIKSLEVYVDGVKWTNKNVAANALTQKTCRLSLCATTNTGKSFFLTDDKLVSWDCSSADGTASVADDGLLTIGADGAGFATGSLRVAETGSLTSSITFGAERYSSYSVVTGSTIGGSVTGGGTYTPGDTVTLTAAPDSGYYFTGWTLEGASVQDTSASAITFTMPGSNVVATANFKSYSSDSDDSSTYSLTAAAGRKVTFKIPSGSDTDCFVPYYLAGGQKVYVSMSANQDGTLTFIAPVAGTYYMEERDVSFTDIDGHWAEDYIKSVAARSLFDGTGNCEFRPDGTMTRAMFVTVLWRLAGSPSGGTGSFTDVETGQWYSSAVNWASNNGIVSGYGNGLFGIDDKVTREQMCAIFARYLNYMGYDTSKIMDVSAFADENSVSSWAAQAVSICHSLGIINGKDGNLFDPAGDATRAECCTVFCRLIQVYLNSIE